MQKSGQQTRIVKTKMHVPIEEEVKVPVFRKEAVQGTTTKVITGQKLIPVKKYREVEEKVVEMKEEVIKGYRTEWREVKVPYTEVVKKPVVKTVMKKVPYTDYEVQEVKKTVTVPTEEIKVKKGYRIDKHIGTKVVETEHEEVYEMQPVLVKRGGAKMKESRLPPGEAMGAAAKAALGMGKTAQGKSIWEDQSEFDHKLHRSLRHWTSEGDLSRPGTTASRRPGTTQSVSALLPGELTSRPRASRDERPMSTSRGRR